MYWPLGAPKIFSVASEHSSELNNEDRLSPPTSGGLLRGLRVSRSGHILATTTADTLSIWHTSPVALVASAVRSKSSLDTYGQSVNVLIRPDSTIAAVQTSQGYIVTYSILVDQKQRVFQQKQQNGHRRKDSLANRFDFDETRIGLQEVVIRFRNIVKVDAGIQHAIALDEEVVVATTKPAAVQCIKWQAEGTEAQSSTEVLQRLSWMSKKSSVTEIVHDRSMFLFVWTTMDGRAYAVQRRKASESKKEPLEENEVALFKGYGFHNPDGPGSHAVKTAVNARFSLIAAACKDGRILIYSVRDYAGSIPLSHELTAPASLTTTGQISALAFSPDGYCLFVGYEHGWAMWSVYGKPGAHSFHSDRTISQTNRETWLLGIQDIAWMGSGSDLLLTTPSDDRIWMLEMARNSVVGCHSPANIARTMLYTNSSLMLCSRDMGSENSTVAPNSTRWDQVQIPPSYIATQRPIRTAVISPDGKYLAVAGRRGLAHYSVHSGRWKTFEDPAAENSFVVRGGMSWYQHILIAAVETADHDEVRLYSRETALNGGSAVNITQASSPVVNMTLTGEDSLLVYTYENVLYHYVIQVLEKSISLIEVGHIGLHGIVRAPARVRAVTWIIPDLQLLDGDPTQDVHQATVLFLVDAKLVLLQPSKDNEGKPRYDMRIIASDVEYYSLTRDHTPLSSRVTPQTPGAGRQHVDTGFMAASLQDSLWYFDGRKMHCWPDVQEVVSAASNPETTEIPQPVPITNDFYPTSIALESGTFLGVEPDIVQRRDVTFALCRFTTRSQLFISSLLRHYLADNDASSALSLAHHFKSLSYFAHALEVLLHTVLDDEVDSAPTSTDRPLLPSVLSFLASFPSYLDIVVQCTRKTEVRSWRTLFRYLPAPSELFDEALEKGQLKTAGGYLLVMHTLEEGSGSMEQCIKLLQLASAREDWELCSELARFLMAMDESGETLRKAMEKLDLSAPGTNGGGLAPATKLGLPGHRRALSRSPPSVTEVSSLTSEASFGSLNSPQGGSNGQSAGDYFYGHR